MSARDTPQRQEAVGKATFDRLFNIAPTERTYAVLTTPRLLSDLEAARERGEDVSSIENQIADATVQLRFRSIGSIAFDDLIGKHPPTDKQKARGSQWDPESFAVALVAASLCDPKLTEDEVRQLMGRWSSGLSTEVYMQALAVNQTVPDPDLPKG